MAAKGSKAAAKHEGTSEAGELLGGVYEGGVHYSRKAPGKFNDAVKGGKISKESLQRLANAGVLSGYGTSSAEAKKAQKLAERSAEEAEA
jgi:hypothetical protein